MDESLTAQAPDVIVQGTGLTVKALTRGAASLRFFDASSEFVGALLPVLGGPLPATLRSIRREVGPAGAQLLLARRSPTETLLLCHDPQCLAAIAAKAAERADGCIVDQSGGQVVLAVSGVRVTDLLLRLGSAESVPAVGEARTSRLAEIAVMSLCVEPDEVLLVVERVYRTHLVNWMRVTAADF